MSIRCVGALNYSPQPPARDARPLAVGEPRRALTSNGSARASTQAPSRLGRVEYALYSGSSESSAKRKPKAKGKQVEVSSCKEGPLAVRLGRFELLEISTWARSAFPAGFAFAHECCPESCRRVAKPEA